MTFCDGASLMPMWNFTVLIKKIKTESCLFFFGPVTLEAPKSFLMTSRSSSCSLVSSRSTLITNQHWGTCRHQNKLICFTSVSRDPNLWTVKCKVCKHTCTNTHTCTHIYSCVLSADRRGESHSHCSDEEVHRIPVHRHGESRIFVPLT